jgi:hypothetical protein
MKVKKMSDETPEHIQNFKKRYKNIKMMLNETDSNHKKAYSHAVDELIKEKKSTLDLDDADVAKKFANNMANFYIKHIEDKFSGNKLSDIDKDMLLKQYAGVTRAELEQYVTQYGKQFEEMLPRIHQQHINKLEEELNTNMYKLVEKNHIEDIAKFTKLKNIDHNYLQEKDAGEILHQYFENNGQVNEHKFRHKVFYKKEKD